MYIHSTSSKITEISPVRCYSFSQPERYIGHDWEYDTEAKLHISFPGALLGWMWVWHCMQNVYALHLWILSSLCLVCCPASYPFSWCWWNIMSQTGLVLLKQLNLNLVDSKHHSIIQHDPRSWILALFVV